MGKVFMKFLPISLKSSDFLILSTKQCLILNYLLLSTSCVYLTYPILLCKQPIFFINLLISFFKTQFFVHPYIITCTWKSVYTGLQILNLGFQNLIFSGELVNLFSILCRLFERDYVLLDCSQLLNPLLGLIELCLNLPELRLVSLELLSQLLVFKNKFLYELVLVLELFHVHRAHLRGSAIWPLLIASSLLLFIVFIILMENTSRLLIFIESCIMRASRTERIWIEIVGVIIVWIGGLRWRYSAKGLQTCIDT